MAIFDFRLQRVLQYREMQEQWAKDAYLAAKAARVHSEETLDGIRERRNYLLESTPTDLDSRRALEHTLIHFDDQDRAQQSIIAILATEETNALAAWQSQKRELDTIGNLREHAHEAWKLDEDRKEQAALDEWAVTRRTA